MLNRVPTIYVPVEAEDNGIALPLLLSIVVHGCILLFVIFTNNIPSIESAQTIETSIISPEELAQIQASISANRESMGSNAAYADNMELSATQDSGSDQQPAKLNQNNAQDRNQSSIDKDNQPHGESSIFRKTDDPADEFDETINAESTSEYHSSYATELNRKRLEIQQTNEQIQQQLEEESRLKHERVAEHFNQERQSQQQTVEQLKNKLNDASNSDLSPSGASGGREIPESLKGSRSNRSRATNDQTTLSLGKGSATNSALGASSNSLSGRSGETSSASIKAALVSHIKPFWSPPKGRIGKSITVDIQVNSDGEVLSVTANSDDRALNDSLEQAIRNASPLTPVVGTKYTRLRPTFKVTN